MAISWHSNQTGLDALTFGQRGQGLRSRPYLALKDAF